MPVLLLFHSFSPLVARDSLLQSLSTHGLPKVNVSLEKVSVSSLQTLLPIHLIYHVQLFLEVWTIFLVRATPTWLMFVDIAGAERVQWKLNKYQELSANTVAFISCRGSYTAGWKLLIFLQFPPDSFCSSDVYRCKSGGCYSLSFILKYFLSFCLSRFSLYINITMEYLLIRARVLVAVGIHQRLLLRGGSDLSAGGNCRIVMNCITCLTIIRSLSTSSLYSK